MVKRDQSENHIPQFFFQRSFSHLRGPWTDWPALPVFLAQNMTRPSLWFRWDMVIIHQPSTTLSIWTVQGYTALIREQVCLKMSLHAFLGALQLFLLVSSCWGWMEALCRTANLWWTLHLDVCGTPEASTTSNTRLLLCNGILAAAFVSARYLSGRNFPHCVFICKNQVCSESAINLLTVRWSYLHFCEIRNVFIPCSRHSTISRFWQQRDWH